MTELELHRWLTWTELGLGVVTLVALIFIVAPYGRTTRAGFGPLIPSRVGWILMEAPASLLWLIIYLQGRHRADIVEFFAKQPPHGAERALARALENLDQRDELKARLVPALKIMLGA